MRLGWSPCCPRELTEGDAIVQDLLDLVVIAPGTLCPRGEELHTTKLDGTPSLYECACALDTPTKVRRTGGTRRTRTKARPYERV
jgi:hypothetical protein